MRTFELQFSGTCLGLADSKVRAFYKKHGASLIGTSKLAPRKLREVPNYTRAIGFAACHRRDARTAPIVLFEIEDKVGKKSGF